MDATIQIKKLTVNCMKIDFEKNYNYCFESFISERPVALMAPDETVHA